MVVTDPSWDLYRTFLAVLEEGSLSGAARALGLTQPTAGRHIEALEQVVGFQLFTRSQRGLAATEAAQELQPYAEAVAAAAAALLRTASGQGGLVRGEVRITASEVMGVEILPPILTGLREQYPDLVVALAASNQIEDLLRRDADIAVRMVEPRQKALLARRIGEVALGVYAHRRYLARHGAPERIEDLPAHSLLGYERETAALRALRQRLPALAPVEFAFKTDSDPAQLAALRAGFGIGFCQRPLARRNPDLVPLLAGSLELRLEVWVAMHEDLKSTPRCRVAFDAVVEGLREYLAG